MAHPPTDEQAHAIDLAKSGRSLVLQAGAGTGKTSTLAFITEAMPDTRFSYVAFNKSIVTDAAGRFPGNTEARTAHSLAHTGVVKGTAYAQRLRGGGRVSPMDLAKMLGTREMIVSTPFGAKRLAAGWLASLATKTVQRFCQTADVKIGPWHVPRQDGLDEPTADGSRGPVMAEVANHVAGLAQKMWADIATPTGVMPFEHGHYLKLWSMADPKIEADVLLLDEAQDLNPCMMAIALNQTNMQLIVVGDSQQAIYGWNGAVDALNLFDIDDTAWLTQSFRFGPAVAEVANEVLAHLNTPLRLTGLESRQSVVTNVRDGQRTILGRTNGLVVREALNAIRAGIRAHVVGGATDVISFAEAAKKLKAGGVTYHHDLACFRTWGEVQDYVDNDPLGEDLRLMVRLVDEFGEDALVAELKNQVKPEHADLVCSTAHKAKGLEWDRVQIGGDFTDPEKREISPEEKRLTYVAVTRAMQELDIASVPLLNQKKEGVPRV